MKNISTLVTRLAALSLAVSLVFSAVDAAAPRKGGPAALVGAAFGAESKALTSNGAVNISTAGADFTDQNFRVGSNCAGGNRNLTVWGTGRFNSDVVIGSISTSKTDSGNKYIIGCVDMNPHTQALSVVFNSPSSSYPDRTPAIGSFEFVTTGTFYHGSTATAPDIGVAGVAVTAGGVALSPFMSAQSIMGSARYHMVNPNPALDFRPTATSTAYNAPKAANGAYDLRLTFTAMPSVVSKEVRIGVIPYNTSTYPKFSGSAISVSGTGFWDGNWVAGNTAPRPVWGCSFADAFAGNDVTKSQGLMSYRIVGNNVSAVGLASTDITAVAATTIDSLVDSLSDNDKLAIIAHIINNLPADSLTDVQTLVANQAADDASLACVTRSPQDEMLRALLGKLAAKK